MVPTMRLHSVKPKSTLPFRRQPDVAKSAAGVVLTEAGLGSIVAAEKKGRITFQHILSYTLRSTLNKMGQVLLLAIGLVVNGHPALPPMLMVIVMIGGDFLAISLTTDRLRLSTMPNSWQFGKFELQLGVEPLRTLTVVAIIYVSQAVTYAIRDPSHLLGLCPTLWVVIPSITDILIISTLAVRGIAMAPFPFSVVAGEFAAAVVFWLILDVVKIPVFARLKIL